MADLDSRALRARAHGFTLVEMMTSLVVVAMGMSIAIPSFQSMMGRNAVVTDTNAFIMSLSRARGEASKTGSVVSVIGKTSASDFSGGWCVVRGAPDDCSGTALISLPAISANSSLVRVTGSDPIRFNAMGGLVGNADIDIDLCHDTFPGRRIHISPIGRTKAHKASLGLDPADPRLPSC